MRLRLAALAALALALAAGSLAIAWATVQLQFQGQTLGASGALNAAQLAEEQQIFVASFALQSMVAPLGTAALLAAAAVLVVLARSRQLRARRVR